MAKIMICDNDAAFMRMMIKDILTKSGYEIAAEAENGAVAVEKYPETKPDLVLMGYYDAGYGWDRGVKEDQRDGSKRQCYHVLRDGTAGNGD